MSSRRPTTRTASLVGLLMVLVVAAAIGLGIGPDRRADGSQCPPLTSEWDPDAPDHDQVVATLATDIVVGRVIALQGSIGVATPSSDGFGYFYPGAMLTIDVLQTVKGSLTGVPEVRAPNNSVNFCQAATFDKPIRAGDTALFLLRRNALDGEYDLLIYNGGYVRIEGDRERLALVARFAAAAATPQASPMATPGGSLIISTASSTPSIDLLGTP